MRSLGWGMEGQGRHWGRLLFAWEEDKLEHSVSLLENIFFAGECGWQMGSISKF